MANASNERPYDESLRAIQSDFRDVETDMIASKINLRTANGHIASVMTNEAARDSTSAELGQPVGRIESRLDIRDR